MEFYFIEITVFLTILLAVVGLGRFGVALNRRKRVLAASLDEVERQKLKGIGQLKPILSDMARFCSQTSIIRPYLEAKAPLFDEQLKRAGNPGMINGEELFALKLLLPLPIFFLTYIVLGQEYLFICIGAGGGSFFLPDLWVRDALKKRQQAIRIDLPDALDSFALMMRAGLDLTQAIDRYIDEEQRSPLQEEFYLMRAEMRLGKTRSDALSSMAFKLGVEEINTIATMVAQSEQAGVSIGDFLADEAESVREHRFQIAEEQGQKAPFKMMAPLMLFIMPCVFLILFAPLGIDWLQRQ